MPDSPTTTGSFETTGPTSLTRLRLDQIHAALRGCFVFSLHRPQVESHGSSIILRGSVGSYYQKQLAQEVLRPLLDEQTLVNELEVREPTVSTSGEDWS